MVAKRGRSKVVQLGGINSLLSGEDPPSSYSKSMPLDPQGKIYMLISLSSLCRGRTSGGCLKGRSFALLLGKRRAAAHRNHRR